MPGNALMAWATRSSIEAPYLSTSASLLKNDNGGRTYHPNAGRTGAVGRVSGRRSEHDLAAAETPFASAAPGAHHALRTRVSLPFGVKIPLRYFRSAFFLCALFGPGCSRVASADRLRSSTRARLRAIFADRQALQDIACGGCRPTVAAWNSRGPQRWVKRSAKYPACGTFFTEVGRSDL